MQTPQRVVVGLFQRGGDPRPGLSQEHLDPLIVTGEAVIGDQSLMDHGPFQGQIADADSGVDIRDSHGRPDRRCELPRGAEIGSGDLPQPEVCAEVVGPEHRLGDEGGFAPSVPRKRTALDLIATALEKAVFTNPVLRQCPDHIKITDTGPQPRPGARASQ